MRFSTLFCGGGILLVVLPSLAKSQLSLSDSSRLRDPAFVEHSVKVISDSALVAAFNGRYPGFSSTARRMQRGNHAAAYRAWAEYWSAKKQPRYTFRTDHLLIDTEMLTDLDAFRKYVRENPEERDSVMTRAAMVLSHRIRTWGDRVEQFGPRVDFNRSLGQSGAYGFHYWLWSRPLTLAYVLTADEKYLACFDTLFQQWYDQRNTITRTIPDFDVVYYELGLAMRNRLFIEYYLLPYRKRPLATHEMMLKTMLGAARWLYEIERWEGYRPGNWQIHGCYTLVQIALVFPEFAESTDWLRLGMERLASHIERDFFADGGHSERSPRNYTQTTYLAYRNLYHLLKTYGVGEDLRGLIRRSLGRTIDWWITLLAPTGEVPAINDSHRGLFPAPVLQDGAEFFSRPEALGVMKRLLGVGSPSDTMLPAYTSRNMAPSGFAVMRTDWTPQALYMNINYGPYGGPHTHSDLLDFEIYAYGRALAVDAGLGLTYDDPLYVPWYKSSPAHNMVVVNGRNMHREGVQGEDVRWAAMGSLDYFAATSRGYDSIGAIQRRHIAFVKPDYWFVFDEIQLSKGGANLEWYIHSPAGLRPTSGHLESVSGPGLAIFTSDSTLHVRTGKGFAASTTVRVAGKTEEISWVSLGKAPAEGSTPAFGVLLMPYRSAVPNPALRQLSARSYEVANAEMTDHLVFAEGLYRDRLIDTDAEFVWVRVKGGEIVHAAVVEGTYVRFEGKEIWRSGERTSWEKAR